MILEVVVDGLSQAIVMVPSPRSVIRMFCTRPGAVSAWAVCERSLNSLAPTRLTACTRKL